MRIAFYSPMKPPDHPAPSGERLMARQLVAALATLGHDVPLVSRLRTFSHDPAPDVLERHRQMAAREVDRLLDPLDTGGRPDLWLTYHPYYKAPDLIGPAVADRLSIPYLTAEASYAPKRDRDQWADWQRPLRTALQRAAVNISMTARDREGLERLDGRTGVILDLPPFLIRPETMPRRREPGAAGRVRLVTVAMMRPGDKTTSYRILAEVLGRLIDLDWELTIVGDGAERSTVAALFEHFPPRRVRFTGELAGPAVFARLAESDLHVWPGIGEAYGLAYLEAAALGVPSLAIDTAGVATVVIDGRTGCLVPEGPTQVEDLAAALARLIGDGEARRRLGDGAEAFVREERSLEATAGRLAAILDRAVGRGGR